MQHILFLWFEDFFFSLAQFPNLKCGYVAMMYDSGDINTCKNNCL